MTLRERILAVYAGERPDVVPFMLDLSHWFLHRHGLPWDLSTSYTAPLSPLLDYHKENGVGFYMPINASLWSAAYPDDVKVTVGKRDSGRRILWRYDTPLGAIERVRIWEPETYSWGIRDWGIESEADLRVLAYAEGNRTFTPHWDRYDAWMAAIGDIGVAYVLTGYSAMGHLLCRWMGVERTTYAIADWPDTVAEVVEQINACNLRCVDMLAAGPAEIIIMGDNFSSDLQPPHFLRQWSNPLYEEAIRRLHAAGKYVAVHIDGLLRGALAMFRDTGADCADAVTPTPMGDLSPAECRAEAGDDFILSGGVSPDLWLPSRPLEEFEAKVLEWLEQKQETSRFMANAGDQVPPGAEERRIAIMRDLVEEHGAFV